jgi:hypothetical protein
MSDQTISALPKNIENISCWVVTEGIAGTENQAIGVCQALGIKPTIKRIKLREPWKSLSPSFTQMSSFAFSSKGDDLKGPYPDLLIAAGRKAVIAALHVKNASKGKTMTVFLQDPTIDPKHFDLVCVPFHDKLRGENVLVTEGAPNRITPDVIKNAQTEYDTAFQALPSPRVAIFIGGKSKRHNISEKQAKSICKSILRTQNDYGAGLMVSASRRTPEAVRAILDDFFTEQRDCIYWDGTGLNPYISMFKNADTFLITEDSVSMLSEAASTGKPVYRIPVEGEAGKFSAFYTYMEERDAVREFDGTLDQWSYRPLKDAQIIAEIIKSELAIRNA